MLIKCEKPINNVANIYSSTTILYIYEFYLKKFT